MPAPETDPAAAGRALRSGRVRGEEANLIGVDWGTSRLRGYRIGPGGKVLERRESNLGIAAIRSGAFEEALCTLIAGWQLKHCPLPILMCGMIGSRQGWREVPYRPCPAGGDDLAGTLSAIETSSGRVYIIAGLSSAAEDGTVDVMRGEETQILGAAPPAGRHLIVAPGTHSKWAMVDDGRIESFRTYMTGEIYALLRKHSSLGWLMAGADDHGDEDAAFLSGVRRGLKEVELLHALFGVRTKGLVGDERPDELASYLSGLLIGSEIAGGTLHNPELAITLIASPPLSRLYQAAFLAAGFSDVRTIDANESVVRGLWHLWQLYAGSNQ